MLLLFCGALVDNNVISDVILVDEVAPDSTSARGRSPAAATRPTTNASRTRRTLAAAAALGALAATLFLLHPSTTRAAEAKQPVVFGADWYVLSTAGTKIEKTTGYLVS